VPGVLGAFVTAVYVLRAAKAIFWGPRPEEPLASLRDLTRTEWAAPVVLGIGLVAFGVLPKPLLDLVGSPAAPAPERPVPAALTQARAPSSPLPDAPRASGPGGTP
jgi:NADH:ubiquinone oxidoreductase subunit 4 (subunit M)